MTIDFLRSLTARQRTQAANLTLGMALAFIAGSLNAAGFLAFAFYTSHVTGLLSSVADNLTLHQWQLVFDAILAIVAFIFGAITSTILINWARRNRMHSEYALSLILEAILLAVFALLGQQLAKQAVIGLPVAALPLCFVMGLQNAVATKLSSARIRTTHMTGIVTDIGIELGRLLYWNRSETKDQHHFVQADRNNLAIHFKIVASFALGGCLGALAFKYVGFSAAWVLSLWLLVLAIVPMLDDVRTWSRDKKAG